MNTHFINARTGAWIKGIEEPVPNLAVGQTVILMEGYTQVRYNIVEIETVISKDTGAIIQNIMLERRGFSD
jgi:hypothetical protein